MRYATIRAGVPVLALVLGGAPLWLQSVRAQHAPAAQKAPALWLKVVHGSRNRPDWRDWQRHDAGVQSRIRQVLADKKSGRYDAASHEHDVALFSERPDGPGGADVPYLLDNADAVDLLPQLLSVVRGRDPVALPAIEIRLQAQGAARMKEFSRRHRGEAVAIVLDGRALIAPVVHGELEDRLLITGHFSQAEVDRIVARLRGAMPEDRAPPPPGGEPPAGGGTR